MLNSIIQVKKQTLQKQIQKKYDIITSVIIIQQQLNKKSLNDEDDTFKIKTVKFKLAE